MSNKHSDYNIRLRAIEAISDGQSVEAVAKAFRYNKSTVHRWLQSYKKNKDIESLTPKPRSGRPRVWSQENDQQLISDVLKPASEFGFETDFWTCRRLVQHIKKRFQVEISGPTMWRYLRKAGLTYQQPEKQYKEANPAAQEEWICKTLPKIQEIVRKYRAILYFEDEATIQLAPVLGKTWALKGQTPCQKVTGNRGSIAVISAISNDGRLIFNLRRGRFNSTDVIRFLTQMLKHHARRHIVVVMDQATPHTSKKTVAFIKSQKRLHVFYLPARSPDLNPDEKVWNHLKHQELKSHQASNLETLTKLTKSKLKKISKNKKTLRGIFLRSKIAKFMK